MVLTTFWRRPKADGVTGVAGRRAAAPEYAPLAGSTAKRRPMTPRTAPGLRDIGRTNEY